MPNPVIPKIPEGAMFLTAANDSLNLMIEAINIGGAPDPDLAPLLAHMHEYDQKLALLEAFQVSATATIDGLTQVVQELEADKVLKDQKILTLENSLADHEKRISDLEAAP